MRVIVSDTSPIRYLVLIGEVDLLQALYRRVLIPEAVQSELQMPQTPAPVKAWLASAPAWIEVASPRGVPGKYAASASLGPGERAAIALGLELGADLLLIDDRTGVEEARRLGLTTIGTLGILARAAERGFVELRAALEKLLATNFRIHPDVVLRLLAESDKD